MGLAVNRVGKMLAQAFLRQFNTSPHDVYWAVPHSPFHRPIRHPVTDLILIRHGETDWNRQLRFQGQVDVPLNDTGLEQSRRVGVRLALETKHQLIASDLIRTQQTAKPIQQHNAGLPLPTAQLNAGLREQNFGLVDGMSVSDIKTQFPQAWAQWIRFDPDFAFAQGESTRVFNQRVMDTVRNLVDANEMQTLVLVTHGGVLDMIYRAAKGLSLSGPRQSVIPNAGINRVRVSSGHKGMKLEVISWGDTQHLVGMPAQPVYDQSKLGRLDTLPRTDI
jgi:2,3-bisphosphoglycerate-dependent phosphoglycerate mutase